MFSRAPGVVASETGSTSTAGAPVIGAGRDNGTTTVDVAPLARVTDSVTVTAAPPLSCTGPA